MKRPWLFLDLLIVELQVHAVVDLVILELDVVFENGVPLLEHDLVEPRPGLGGDELLQVANRVVLVALDADLLSQSVVNGYLDHSCRLHVISSLKSNLSQSTDKEGQFSNDDSAKTYLRSDKYSECKIMSSL